MKYKFEVNGNISLMIEPQNNLEIELFKTLFAGEVTVKAVTSTNPNGGYVISKVPKGVETPQ